MRGRLYDLATAPLEHGVLGRFVSSFSTTPPAMSSRSAPGPGHNLAHYPAARITRLDLTEPDPVMRRRLSDKVEGLPDLPIRITAASGRRAVPRAAYDTVVGTLVLCTVPDPEAALAAMVGALAPGGRLIYIEHVRSDRTSRRRPSNDALAPLWSRIADGCQLTGQTHALMRSFGLVPIEKEVLRLPPPVHLAHAGVAVRQRQAMTGSLALLGGGEWQPACRDLDRQLLEDSGGGEVVVLPTAAAFEDPGAVIDAADLVLQGARRRGSAADGPQPA